jgi:molecular chaperone DnaK
MAKDNRLLGVFQLVGIPPAPRGIPQVEVTFDIDANGIINVTAKDKATNNEQKVTITTGSGLSKEEIDKMARDAESHASEDQKRKDEIDARNKADATPIRWKSCSRIIVTRSARKTPKRWKKRSKTHVRRSPKVV